MIEAKVDAEVLKKRTKDFALRVLRSCQALPKNYMGDVVGKQLLRSATSVAVNYRAACRARSQAEFSAKLQIVIEEADESAFWLELIEESGLLPAERLSDLRKEADELTAIFVSSRKTVTRNLRNPS
jgi:four helix bundle protein